MKMMKTEKKLSLTVMTKNQIAKYSIKLHLATINQWFPKNNLNIKIYLGKNNNNE